MMSMTFGPFTQVRDSGPHRSFFKASHIKVDLAIKQVNVNQVSSFV